MAESELLVGGWRLASGTAMRRQHHASEHFSCPGTLPAASGAHLITLADGELGYPTQDDCVELRGKGHVVCCTKRSIVRDVAIAAMNVSQWQNQAGHEVRSVGHRLQSSSKEQRVTPL